MTCKEVLHMARSMGRRPSAAVCQERRSGSDGAPAAYDVQIFFASRLLLCRHGKQPKERAGGRTGRKASAKLAPISPRRRVPAAPLPSFLPSFPKASAQRKGFSSYYAKKEEYNITGPAQPGWVPKVPDTFGKHRESNFRKGRLSRPF